MKISLAVLAGTWLSSTVWAAFSTDTNIVHLIKSIPNSAICPDTICPENSFVRRDDAGDCGCSNTGAGGSCDFIKCATGPPIQNPVTGHCLCPPPHTIPAEPTCVRVPCPLGGTAHYNSTLGSCACPSPPCLTKCHDGYRAGFDSVTGACTCIREPVCPPDIVLCRVGLSYGFNEATLTCGCFPSAQEIAPNSIPHQAAFKACGILCKDGYTLDAATCTCVPTRPCDIQCKDGFTLDTKTCTCVPVRPCDIFCKQGTKLDAATCTCAPIKPCNIFCKDGLTLDTTTCACIPPKPCDILCKAGTHLDTTTCTCILSPRCDIVCEEGTRVDGPICSCVPIKPCNIFCKEGTIVDTTTCTCIPPKPCDVLCKAGTHLDTTTCTCTLSPRCDIVCEEGTRVDGPICSCVPIRPCNIFCKEGTTLDTATCTCVPNAPTSSPPLPGASSNPSDLPTPNGRCATFALCPKGRVTGFAPLTLECGCMNCDALHCPDNQQAQFDPASQKCYCPGVPGECFDLVCPPPEQQLVFQQVQNPDGTVSEGCACKSTL